MIKLRNCIMTCLNYIFFNNIIYYMQKKKKKKKKYTKYNPANLTLNKCDYSEWYKDKSLDEKEL